MSERPSVATVRTSVLVATAGGLIFQLGHLLEHTLQMVIWFVHPQRAPWMSPWAHELALALGRIPAADSAEMTSAMQRGMEVLHLVGNAIFLIAAAGVFALVRAQAVAKGSQAADATSWARAGLVLQLLHTVEHVALTASVLATGRAVGLSTWFGTMDGTLLSTQRVWWHGLVNLFASMVVGRAVWLALRTAPERAPRMRQLAATRQPSSVAFASVALIALVPTTLAMWVGESAESADPHEGHMADAAMVTSVPGLYDVAASLGLDATHDAFRWDVSGDPVAMMGGGLCWIDVDDDGWLDLFVTNTWSDGEWGLWNSGAGLPTTQIYRNDEGRFVDFTEQWGAGFAVRAVGCTATDLDADGDTDLYVTTSRSNLLLLNRAGEGFDEVAEIAGADVYGWQAGAAAGDLDGDGLTDVFLTGYADLNSPRSDSDSGFPNTVQPLPDTVLFGTGIVDGVPRFVEVSAASLGVEPDGPEYGLDVVLVDIDSDGDLDVHVANDTQANRLYRNDLNAGGGMVDIAGLNDVDDTGSGMGVAITDVNADGAPDIAVTNLAGQGHRLFVSEATGWSPQSGGFEALGSTETGWGVAFPDLDNDGVPDAVVASGDIPIVSDTQSLPVRVLRGGVAGFEPWIFESGAPVMPLTNGRSVAPADFDNDGDLDLAISSIGAPIVLLENRIADHRSLTLDLGPAVAGTLVLITFDDGSVLTRQVWSGGHWLSGADPRIHVGLGSDRVVESIDVQWPSGERSSTSVPPHASAVSLSPD